MRKEKQKDREIEEKTKSFILFVGIVYIILMCKVEFIQSCVGFITCQIFL